MLHTVTVKNSSYTRISEFTGSAHSSVQNMESVKSFCEVFRGQHPCPKVSLHLLIYTAATISHD